jgi:hypothetical protein
VRNFIACLAGTALTAACGSSTPTPSAATGDAASDAKGDAADSATSADISDTTAAGDGATPSDSAARSDTNTTKPDTGSTTLLCKPWDDTGTCGTGKHCGYDDLDKVACVDDGSHAVGEDCSDGKGCKAGACITNKSGKQRCTPYCATDVHCQSNLCGGVEGKKWKVCDLGDAELKPCNPSTQDCAGAGEACLYYGGGFVCLPKSESKNTPKGEPCDESTDCKPGLYCAGVATGSKGVCRAMCKPKGTPACDPPTVPCVPISGSFGYCDGPTN